MKRFLSILIFILAFSQLPQAQTKAADSVVIRVGEGSKVIFAIKDKKDLETLKQYDFQALMDDMLAKLENNDTTAMKKPSKEYLKDSTAVLTTASVESQTAEVKEEKNEEPVEERWKDENWNEHEHKKWRGRRTYHSFNMDFGINNYLSDGTFPDATNELYTVKPWGSWYVGINSVQRTRLAQKFFLEWAGGVSWYNFKFQNASTVMSKDDTGVKFTVDPRDVEFVKSKLTATYLNVSVVPLVDFSGNKRRTALFEGHGSDSFRFGVGPYAGYRIDSYYKQVYKDDGDKRKTRERDNFYLNNMRYGLRAQIGFDDIDLFINYDLNELFTTGKGPLLNAFSFGITL